MARIRHVHIAPSGAEILQLMGDEAISVYERALSGIGPDQLRATLVVLNTIRANIKPADCRT